MGLVIRRLWRGAPGGFGERGPAFALFTKVPLVPYDMPCRRPRVPAITGHAKLPPIEWTASDPAAARVFLDRPNPLRFHEVPSGRVAGEYARAAASEALAALAVRKLREASFAHALRAAVSDFMCGAGCTFGSHLGALCGLDFGLRRANCFTGEEDGEEVVGHVVLSVGVLIM
jgi:hypothetical protein